MRKNEFIENVIEAVKLVYPTAKVSHEVVSKNNGTVKDALIISGERKIAPTIYLDEFYDALTKGVSFDEVVSRIVDLYRNSEVVEVPDLDFLKSAEEVKSRLMVKLVNTEKNTELLETLPHKEILNLSAIFYVELSLHNQQGTVVIKNEHIEKLGLTTDEMYEAAKQNTKNKLGTCICDIREVLMEMLGHEDCNMEEHENILDMDVFEESPMYVMSNRKKYFGAATLLDEEALRDFSKKIGKDFYILPSSIHETILVPAEIMGESEESKQLELEHIGSLLRMVQEVNSTQLMPEEVLADAVYKFSNEKLEVYTPESILAEAV